MEYLLIFLILGVVAFLIRWFFGKNKFELIKRRLGLVRDVPEIEIFDETWSYGRPVKTRVVLRPQAVRAQADLPKADTPESRVAKAPVVESPRILDEQIALKMSRWPGSEFRLPKYQLMSFLGEEWIYELIPVAVEVSGYLRFATIEIEEDHAGRADVKRRWRRSRRPLRVWDYMVKGDPVATLVEHRFTREKFGHHVTAPRNGHIVSFQVLNGTKVDAHDVILFLAAKTDLPL